MLLGERYFIVNSLPFKSSLGFFEENLRQELEDDQLVEGRRLMLQIKVKNLRPLPSPKTGNCFYFSIAEILKNLGLKKAPKSAKKVRQTLMQFINENFGNYRDSMILDPEDFKAYPFDECADIQPSLWMRLHRYKK